MSTKRIFSKIVRNNLPQVKDKYPFLYLEHGILNIDDSSVKWVNSVGEVIRLPIATINSLFLGPGTSLTHAAIKTIAATNCTICWIGEDGFFFYAYGQTPTADSRNFKRQIDLATSPKKSLELARRLFAFRFPDLDLQNKNLREMQGMEGKRVKEIYEEKAKKYGVGWQGRRYRPGKFELSDVTNKFLTVGNSFLYGITASVIHSLGYSPYVGFIHSGSPLPFVYDLADLYKEQLCIDPAFRLTLENAGEYNRDILIDNFRAIAIERKLLDRIVNNIKELFSVKNASNRCQ